MTENEFAAIEGEALWVLIQLCTKRFDGLTTIQKEAFDHYVEALYQHETLRSKYFARRPSCTFIKIEYQVDGEDHVRHDFVDLDPELPWYNPQRYIKWAKKGSMIPFSIDYSILGDDIRAMHGYWQWGKVEFLDAATRLDLLKG